MHLTFCIRMQNTTKHIIWTDATVSVGRDFFLRVTSPRPHDVHDAAEQGDQSGGQPLGRDVSDGSIGCSTFIFFEERLDA